MWIIFKIKHFSRMSHLHFQIPFFFPCCWIAAGGRHGVKEDVPSPLEWMTRARTHATFSGRQMLRRASHEARRRRMSTRPPVIRGASRSADRVQKGWTSLVHCTKVSFSVQNCIQSLHTLHMRANPKASFAASALTLHTIVYIFWSNRLTSQI